MVIAFARPRIELQLAPMSAFRHQHQEGRREDRTAIVASWPRPLLSPGDQCINRCSHTPRSKADAYVQIIHSAGTHYSSTLTPALAQNFNSKSRAMGRRGLADWAVPRRQEHESCSRRPTRGGIQRASFCKSVEAKTTVGRSRDGSNLVSGEKAVRSSCLSDDRWRAQLVRRPRRRRRPPTGLKAVRSGQGDRLTKAPPETASDSTSLHRDGAAGFRTHGRDRCQRAATGRTRIMQE